MKTETMVVHRNEAPAVRLAAGLALLDSQRPGWADAIDLEALEMWSLDQCVLAQLYGTYWGGYVALGLATHETYDAGFCLPTDDWRPEILARRSAP